MSLDEQVARLEGWRGGEGLWVLCLDDECFNKDIRDAVPPYTTDPALYMPLADKYFPESWELCRYESGTYEFDGCNGKTSRSGQGSAAGVAVCLAVVSIASRGVEVEGC